MTIYIDPEYKCYTTAAENRRGIETDYFNGKCAAYVEGYIYLPKDETTVINGRTFTGPMVTPWKPYAELKSAQDEYEKNLLNQKITDLETELAAAKILLGVD